MSLSLSGKAACPPRNAATHARIRPSETLWTSSPYARLFTYKTHISTLLRITTKLDSQAKTSLLYKLKVMTAYTTNVLSWLLVMSTMLLSLLRLKLSISPTMQTFSERRPIQASASSPCKGALLFWTQSRRPSLSSSSLVFWNVNLATSIWLVIDYPILMFFCGT